MRHLAILAGLTLVAGCATTEEEVAVIQPEPEPIVVEDTGPEAGSQEDFLANAGPRVFFAYDQYSLSSAAQATLRTQAAWLAANPTATIQIAGNADERGTREYNLALGSRRAEATKAYLISLGVSANRMSTVSYGKERPIAQGSTEAAWARNRNATTSVR